MYARNPAVNDPASAASISGSVRPEMIDGQQSLRMGLELVRASQLTMLRLQLALHEPNRRTAMQALDTLLDIDAEMEDLAATLGGVPSHPANDAALSGFIGLQKAAIAAEKHALTGGDAASLALSAPGEASLAAQPVFSDDNSESVDRPHGRRRKRVLAVAIVAIIVASATMALLWPASVAAVVGEIP